MDNILGQIKDIVEPRDITLYSYIRAECQLPVICKIGKVKLQREHYFNHFGILGSSPPESGEGSLQ